MGFNPFTITIQGANLAAKTLIGKKLKFTKFKVGDGEQPDNVELLEDLVNPVMSINFTSILKTSETQVTIKALLKNIDAPQNFYWKELGLYAQDPDTNQEILFAYANYGENPDYIENSNLQPIDRYIQQIIAVGNADNVIIEINSDIVYVTHEELELEVNKLKKKAGKIYGIRRNLGTSSTEWERIEDAVGLTVVATQNETETVKNDFDNIYPWSDIISYNYDVQGERITAYYGEPTFTFDGSNGEVMTRVPEFWCKREQKDGYEYIYIADYEAEGFIKVEQFSIGRYISSGTIESLHSKSGVNILANIAPENIRNSIKSLGKGWSSLDILHWSIIQILYLVEYADYNAQNKLGKGCSTDDVIAQCGGTNNLGMKSGCILPDNGKSQVIYRGIEDLFGNVLQFCDGINILNTGVVGFVVYVSYDSTKYKCNDNLENIVSINLPMSSGFISKIGYDEKNPLIQLPVNVAGSSDTYISDNYAAPTTGDEAYTVVWIGGCATHNQQAGLWYYGCNFISSFTNKYRGCRLILNK